MFTGSYDELATRLSLLDGEWDDTQKDRKIFRLDDGIMNWYEPSGSISFQGKSKGKSLLEEKVPELLDTEDNANKIQKRITELVDAVCAGMFEREEIIAVSLLGALCGQNTFLYGPPGTAKSLISRRIACAFASPTYFEYLMNRFSTPEELFGPVSIKALKEDRYTRKTDSYLPKAEFAFLDEIWKSSPAILNTLLTLINERVFRNGEIIEKAPLKALIAASNETPESNQGLEALYDRFIVRVMVGPISQNKNFNQLLTSKPTEAAISIPDNLLVKPDEWVGWGEQLHDVSLSTETLTIIHLIRDALDEQSEKLDVYVSDRRWQRAAILMRASAFFNGREETNHSDAVLLKHCLWSHDDNREPVVNIVASAIKDAGFDSGVSLHEIDRQKDELDKEINKELFYTADVYETKRLNGHEYFYLETDFSGRRSYRDEPREIYIPYKKLKAHKKFHPVDVSGNTLDVVWCRFDGQGTCEISLDKDSHYGYETIEFQPKVLLHKGEKKEDINRRLVDSLAESVKKLRESLSDTLDLVQSKYKGYKQALLSPFISEEDVQLAITGVAEQIDRLRLRIKDCERLEELCR
jgi:MoxR-like ATPase